MANTKRYVFVGLFLLLIAPLSMQAQHLTNSERPAPYKTERLLIETTLQTIVAILQETTMQKKGSGLGDRLRDITTKLSNAAALTDPTPSVAPAAAQDDLEELRRLLRDIAQQLEAIREELEEEDSYDLADKVSDVQHDLRQAVRKVDRMTDQETHEADRQDMARVEDGEQWLRPGRYGNQRARARDDRERARRDRDVDDEDREEALDRRIERIEDDIEATIEDEIEGEVYRSKRDRDDERRRSDWDWDRYTGAFVGEFSYRWPFRRDMALYHSIPALRYNRVEGFVLGIGRRPMQWNSYNRADVYGQFGYAFALDEWRYEAGAEVRIDNRRSDDYGLKLGVSYRHNTDTKDTWKTSWLENSLAAFFFENDFFDYYDVEGWSVYAVQRFTPYVQLTAGFRAEDYRSLEKQTGWSLFDGDGFGLNPAINDGSMQSLVFALEGGRVRGLHSLPRGVAFRFESEIGDGLGGDFAFNRFIGDVRAYTPINDFSSLGFRLRGGLTTGDVVPLQKQFTLGGIGSVRGYPQNVFLGSRMLLGNAEYIIDGIDVFDDIFDDFQLIGFADVGWVNVFGTDEFSFDDIIPSAGFGVGLDDRSVRLELAFPLRDLGFSRDPSLWLRITPSF